MSLKIIHQKCIYMVSIIITYVKPKRYPHKTHGDQYKLHLSLVEAKLHLKAHFSP